MPVLCSLRRQRGFTLLELLVSVVVLAILTAVIYSTLAPNKDTARNTRVIAATQDAYAKAKTYAARTGSYSGFDAINYAIWAGASSQVWTHLFADPGNLDPRVIFNNTTRVGGAGTLRRVWMKVLDEPDEPGAGIAICSTGPGLTTYCLREYQGRVSYLTVAYSASAGYLYTYLGSSASGYPSINRDSWGN